MSAAKFEAALAHGDADIGALVYWRDLFGLRIPRDVFRTGMRACGLGGALARDPSPEKLLNVAAGTANRKQDRTAPRVKVELKAKGTHAVYAVLARRDVEADCAACAAHYGQPGGPCDEGKPVASPHRNGAPRPSLRVRYLEETTVAVDREHGGSLIVHDLPGTLDDVNREDVVKRVVDEYADLLVNAHGQEVSETLTRAMDSMGALPLRTGTYFVPASQLGAVRALRDFIEKNTKATITSWIIRGDDENAATAKRDAREAMLDRIECLVTEVREFTESTPVEDAATKSVNAAVRKFRELDGKVQLYADILGDYVSELHGAIADAKQRLLGAYLGDADDQAADAA